MWYVLHKLAAFSIHKYLIHMAQQHYNTTNIEKVDT